ncbi:glycerol-3-phosphate dehydrogenase, partial [Tulasnella sp. 408]
VDGRPLTEIINERNENVKYLPGINIGSNVRAEPDLAKALKGATALVIVLPHQFLNGVLKNMKGHVEEGARAVTLIKGVDVRDGRISTFASLISKELDVSCSALIAADKYSESTLGVPYNDNAQNEDPEDHPEAQLWKPLFETPTFRIQVVEDVDGVSLCGALKNVVAMAAGFVDGLGWGDNSKAAIMRIGMLEIHDFCLEFFPGTKSTTFLVESCGVADIMTSCMGGRNRKVAMEMVKTKKSFQELEKDLLNGQKLQGALTALEVHQFLDAHGVDNIKRKKKYPLFENVWKICFEGMEPTRITDNL